MRTELRDAIVSLVLANYSQEIPVVFDNDPFDWNSPPETFIAVETEFYDGIQVGMSRKDQQTRLFGCVHIHGYSRLGTGVRKAQLASDEIAGILNFQTLGSAQLQARKPSGNSTSRGFNVEGQQIPFYSTSGTATPPVVPPVPPEVGGGGNTNAFELTAVQNLGGHRVLVSVGANGADYANSSNLNHCGRVVGISTAAVSIGLKVMIQRSGLIHEPSWGWIPDQDVWLGENGMIQQSPPSFGFLQRLGVAVSPTDLWVDMYEPITL